MHFRHLPVFAKAALSVLALLAMHPTQSGAYDFKKPLYGAAYYSEYTPTDRLDEDIRLMKVAGLTVVRNGGEVVMFYKSGYTDFDNAAYPMRAPGYLAETCGFTYQEFSTIKQSWLKGNLLGEGDNTVDTWLEFLQPTTAKPMAYLDDPFFGQWPCITENFYGKGHLIYLATEPSEDLLDRIVVRAASRKGIKGVLGFPVIARSAVNPDGENVHFIFNYSGSEKEIEYPFPNGKSLLDSSKIKTGQKLRLEPWGVFIGID